MFARLSPVTVGLCLSLLAGSFTSAIAQVTEPHEELASDEWASVRASYEASRHAVVKSEEGFAARNPRQCWEMSFDGRAFTVAPDSRAWTWGLELMSYGFVGHERELGELACVQTAGGRVAYTWDDTLEEWYVNDTRGFEHGFTVRDRPDGEGFLTLALRVRGSLTPAVQENRRDVRFLDEHGATVLNYSGLTVFDANGRSLRAWFEENSQGLLLRVDEREARYPLTIDPIAQQALLLASNASLSDAFGHALAISGNLLVVGAPSEDSEATGVNGDETLNWASSAGAAYVFVRDGSTWIQQAYLKASNTLPGGSFGWSVSISGETVVVGARWESSSTKSGAAYVFVRSGTIWSQQAYLKASNTGNLDSFGESVAIEGDTIVVGANLERSNATGVNGNESDDSEFGAGAAYVFVRSGTTWSQQAYLKALSADRDDHFGSAVSISGDTVVVGASGESSSAVGVNGNYLSNASPSAGAAYVFTRSGTVWSHQAYLKASNTGNGDLFGESVSVSGNTIVVGTSQEDSSSTGIDGDQTDSGSQGTGAVYAFVWNGFNWSQQAYIKASTVDSGDQFGCSVALEGDRLVVGAWGEASNATGTGGDQTDNSLFFSGAAYAFVRDGTTWSQQDYFKASTTGAPIAFGFSVAVSGESVLVGAVGNTGAAYLFGFNGPFVSICSGDGGNQAGCTDCPCGNNAAVGSTGGCLNSAGRSSRLEGSGDPSVSLPPMSNEDLRFTLFGAPANALCILNSGDNLAPGNMANPCFGLDSGARAAVYDGLRCAVMNTRRHGGRVADASGAVGVTTNPWGGEGGPQAGIASAGSGFAAGQTRYFQVIYRENSLHSCMRGLNTSQALEILFTP